EIGCTIGPGAAERLNGNARQPNWEDNRFHQRRPASTPARSGRPSEREGSHMPHDLVIREGIILDGSGNPGFTGDVSIDGDRLTQVGGKAGAGRREIRAAGLAVSPGFIDPHTHYDAQICWDHALTPSCWQGITTVVMGNCGFTLAPCRPSGRERIMRMLERVEGMSLAALEQGIRWDWETFPEYLDALAR